MFCLIGDFSSARLEPGFLKGDKLKDTARYYLGMEVGAKILARDCDSQSLFVRIKCTDGKDRTVMF